MAQGNEITLRKYEDFLLGKVAFSIKGPSDIEKEPEGDDADIEEAKAERKRKIADAKQKEALAIVRYAVTELLEWTPQDAMDSMNEEIMEQLRLDKIITYIRYPKDLSKKKDFISKNLVAKSVAELYEIFGDSAKGNILMHDAKLFYAYHELYDTPLEYLHESLGSSRDEFLYSYYQYMSALTEIEKEKTRKKRTK